MASVKGNVERRRGFLPPSVPPAGGEAGRGAKTNADPPDTIRKTARISPPSLGVPPVGGEVLTIGRVAPFALFTLMLLALLLPLGPLAANRFHHDEALYSAWALLIASGRDPLLDTVPVDKPPLFLYTLALFFKAFGLSETVARWPSLLATVAAVPLVFGLGRRLYDAQTGLLAAALFVLSPFTILFAPTALTDPLLVTLLLAACWAAASGRPAWAGLLAGLALATKQQAVFFLPLVLALAWRGRTGRLQPLNPPALRAPRFTLHALWPDNWLLRTVAAFALPVSLTLLWDAARSQRPGFLVQSAVSYGGLRLSLASFGARFGEFVDLLRYAAPTPWLQAIFLVGLPLLLLAGISKMPTRQAIADWLLAGFCFLFLLGHAAFSFEAWDRYLLGLIPLLALLLARVLIWPWRLGIGDWVLDSGDRRLLHLQSLISNIQSLMFVVLLALAFARPVQDAVASRYPIGGDHGAYQGVDEAAAYLRRHAGASVTLYHRWLGAHWQFYLWDYPYDFRNWQTEAELAALASERREAVQYVAFPAWRSETTARLALADAGLALREVFRAYRPDGAPALLLYRIEPVR